MLKLDLGDLSALGPFEKSERDSWVFFDAVNVETCDVEYYNHKDVRGFLRMFPGVDVEGAISRLNLGESVRVKNLGGEVYWVHPLAEPMKWEGNKWLTHGEFQELRAQEQEDRDAREMQRMDIAEARMALARRPW